MKLAVAALAATLLLAACGDSSSRAVAPESYMQSVCSALGPWESAVRTRSTALTPPAGAAAPQRKQNVQAFLAAVIADTSTAIDRLRQAGSPNVAGGSRLAANLVGAFEQLRAAYTRAAQQAANLPTSSVSALQKAVAGISTTIDTSLSNISTRLSALGTPQFKAAAGKAPACKKLVGSSA